MQAQCLTVKGSLIGRARYTMRSIVGGNEAKLCAMRGVLVWDQVHPARRQRSSPCRDQTAGWLSGADDSACLSRKSLYIGAIEVGSLRFWFFLIDLFYVVS